MAFIPLKMSKITKMFNINKLKRFSFEDLKQFKNIKNKEQF